jgi:hypothetical protein
MTSQKPPKLIVSKNCPSCGGDGLYKRHTSYTVGGKPICFRCEGTGTILVKQPTYTRLYQVYDIEGCLNLVRASERKNYFSSVNEAEKYRKENDIGNIEIPF